MPEKSVSLTKPQKHRRQRDRKRWDTAPVLHRRDPQKPVRTTKKGVPIKRGRRRPRRLLLSRSKVALVRCDATSPWVTAEWEPSARSTVNDILETIAKTLILQTKKNMEKRLDVPNNKTQISRKHIEGAAYLYELPNETWASIVEAIGPDGGHRGKLLTYKFKLINKDAVKRRIKMRVMNTCSIGAVYTLAALLDDLAKRLFAESLAIARLQDRSSVFRADVICAVYRLRYINLLTHNTFGRLYVPAKTEPVLRTALKDAQKLDKTLKGKSDVNVLAEYGNLVGKRRFALTGSAALPVIPKIKTEALTDGREIKAEP